MKLLGIIGGTGPESTVEYYRLLISSYRDAKRDGSYPQLLINSIDNQKLLALIGAKELQAVTDWLVREVERLAAAGAEFGLFAANTPHIVFDEVQRQSSIPLLSIVKVTCAAAKTQSIKTAGLFGTRFTMQGGFYPRVFSREAIRLIVPKLEEQEYIHHIYMSELLNGIFLPDTRTRMLSIVDRLREQEQVDGLILGGTELPLLLKDQCYAGIPFLNTVAIHVEQAVRAMMQ